MREAPANLRRALLAAAAAMVVCLGLLSLFEGPSSVRLVRLAQAVAVFGLGAVIVGGAVVLALVRLGGWRDPESEVEFEALVQRSERLAADDEWDDGWGRDDDDDQAPDLDELDEFDLYEEETFKALVRAALDELPLEFHRALEHVAVVVADNGASVGASRGTRRGAYGLYQGGTVANDFFHDRIVIFRDTLLRDFGHDPQLLRAQVTRTVRHELAHHLGWDEKGVRGLGL
jgi:predicted Zn-dependent protease with MMP-like domain